MSVLTAPDLLNSARWAGMRIGLLGGSFNPPHEGHVHISLAALKGLHLDAIWWLVTPQNPLKCQKPPPLDARIVLSQKIATHPKIIVSGIEKKLGTAITYETVKRLKNSFPKTKFVWISGMDNARSLHTWHHWRHLLAEISTLHITRNPAKSLVQNCPLKMYKRQNHVFIDKAAPYPIQPGTTYWMMQKKMVHQSSTQIRESLNTQADIL